MTWIITPNIYTKFLDITKRYGLLKVYDEYLPPTRDSKGHRVKVYGNQVSKGLARLIGPGPALQQEYAAFQSVWKQIQQGKKKVA